jgi:hypothetical protein
VEHQSEAACDAIASAARTGARDGTRIAMRQITVSLYGHDDALSNKTTISGQIC